jgi:hypothetical protein
MRDFGWPLRCHEKTPCRPHQEDRLRCPVLMSPARSRQQVARRLIQFRVLRIQELLGQVDHSFPIVRVPQFVERICQSKALLRQQIRLQERPQP